MTFVAIVSMLVLFCLFALLRPLWDVWSLRDQHEAIHGKPSCRYCTLALLCAPAGELFLCMISLSMAIGLVADPDLMAQSKSAAMEALLQGMPQGDWAACLFLIGFMHAVSLWRGGIIRFAALFVGLFFWFYMTYATLGAAHAWAPWIYGPIAATTFGVLLLVSWERGRVE